MDLNEYFKHKEGIGILSTADAEGNVNAAVYATPHVIDSDSIAFIMRPRRSYDNVSQNPHAAYLFIRKSAGYEGKRFALKKTHEETDLEKVNLLRRSHHGSHHEDSRAILVYFQITEIRPLVGDNPSE